jgi:hypothetical protein
MEFIQFHPSAIYTPTGEAYLVSEAVRGEGAHLLNQQGERFMVGKHELAELAPRDIVAQSIFQQMKEHHEDYVYLSLKHLDPEKIKKRFPNIFEKCAELGIDMTDRIPVACKKIGHSEQDWNLGGYTVEPGTCDTLIVTLRLKNESMLGNYYNVMRFMINGEVDYNYGFMIDVPVREDFDHWSEEEKARAPHFMVDSTERNFGTLREGEESKMIFKIQNVGERNLIIRKIETTCGCTAVLPGQRVLLSGKEMDLNVIFHSAGRSGKQRKVITLFCNDPRQPKIQLVVKGEVN